jgi:hypothetical protein
LTRLTCDGVTATADTAFKRLRQYDSGRRSFREISRITHSRC